MSKRQRGHCSSILQRLAEFCEKDSGTVIHHTLPSIYPLSGGEFRKRQDLYLEPKRAHFATESYPHNNDIFHREDISTQLNIRPLTCGNLWLAGKGRYQRPSRIFLEQNLLHWRNNVAFAQEQLRQDILSVERTKRENEEAS